jgi:hypothetical protein
MDWTNWQSYTAPAIVLVVIAIFIRNWIKKSETNCCGGRCGCGVSKRKKKLGVKNARP